MVNCDTCNIHCTQPWQVLQVMALDRDLSKPAEDGDDNVGKTMINYRRQKAHIHEYLK